MKRYFLMFKMVFVLVLISILFLLPTNLKAQGVLPCNGGDPTADCPIDLSVWFLVAGVVVLSLIARFRIKHQQIVKN